MRQRLCQLVLALVTAAGAVLVSAQSASAAPQGGCITSLGYPHIRPCISASGDQLLSDVYVDFWTGGYVGGWSSCFIELTIYQVTASGSYAVGYKGVDCTAGANSTASGWRYWYGPTAWNTHIGASYYLYAFLRGTRYGTSRAVDQYSQYLNY